MQGWLSQRRLGHQPARNQCSSRCLPHREHPPLEAPCETGSPRQPCRHWLQQRVLRKSPPQPLAHSPQRLHERPTLSPRASGSMQTPGMAQRSPLCPCRAARPRSLSARRSPSQPPCKLAARRSPHHPVQLHCPALSPHKPPACVRLAHLPAPGPRRPLAWFLTSHKLSAHMWSQPQPCPQRMSGRAHLP